jgi:hypothetical protein
MSMRNLMMVLVSLSFMGLALAAEPDAKSQAKTAATKAPVSKQAVAKPSAKPAAPKYYYVRGDSMPAVSAADVSAPAPVPQVQVTAPEAGEVHTGRMLCELGNSVTVTPDPQQSTRFVVQMKKNTYFMTPVATTTGAVRLEDAQAGAMWLQLPHKSMLMNSKLGQRMADECQSEHQTVAAHAMKLNPPPSLLDSPTLAKK